MTARDIRDRVSADRSTMATIPMPAPDPVPPLAALAERIAADRATYARGERALSPADAARLRRLVVGEGCRTCGRAAPEPRCRACAGRAIGATG